MLTAWTGAETWGLIGLLGLSTFLLLGFFVFFNLYAFLAVNKPEPANILVIDGWLPDYALTAAIDEFQCGSYETIVTLGLPLPQGRYFAQYKTYADLAAATLNLMGVEANQLAAVPVPDVYRDRTLTSAKALIDWLETYPTQVTAINLYTMGPHARRSWLLYRRVVPQSVGISVGIIAATPREYDPDRWWQYSAGARAVISELVGFIYVCFARAHR